MKRLMLLMLAWMLALGTAALAETVPDIPLSAADSPVKLEELVPMDASKIVLPEVKYLPGDMPWIVGQEDDETYEYYILSAKPDILPEVELYRSPADRYQLTSYSGALVPMTDGRWALRYAADEDEVARLTLIYAYSDQDYDEKIIIDYFGGYAGGELRLFETELWVTTPERELVYIYQENGQLSEVFSRSDASELEGQPANYAVGYFGSGQIDSGWVDEGSRRYQFYGTSLWEISDSASGITAYYDEVTGLMSSYDLERESDAYFNASEKIVFSCYGTVLWAEFPNREDLNNPWFWAPGIGWYMNGSGKKVISPEASAYLPDLENMTPPLPAVPLPDYRLDAERVSDLPPLPVAISEMPGVADWQREDDRLLLTLDGPLSEGFDLRVYYDLHLEHEESSVQSADAEPIGEQRYAFAVPSTVETDDLWLRAVKQAADASSFTAVYTRRPLDGPWLALLTSYAADIGYTLDDEGRVAEAVIYNYLSGLNDFYRMTFDEETGALTRYDYSVSLPFVNSEAPHLFWWHREYTITYVPGEGIVSAVCGDPEAPYTWSPETGWTAPDGGDTSFLYDPLDFPHKYPFPVDS